MLRADRSQNYNFMDSNTKKFYPWMKKKAYELFAIYLNKK